ncbi:conjugative transfer signal peptidase TraF (plasmid) [Shewanella xiamenensis]|uniref:conjugative transfer signal peptidase TraF n=1 Tax=Shewanella xiamenensis TaxID=332186 RepID=UPI0024AD06C0|nr:conjugative transfer signal peptidase TraF [Shewanella xiamenensis]WHF58035.1 conjugative transfer signal peptidase TraF [Shewanella xiamenensis]
MSKATKYWLLSISIFTAAVSVAYFIGIRINTSKSFPPGIYIVSKANSYKKNDLVLFCPPNKAVMQDAIERGYIDTGRCESDTVPIIKRIVGMSGDYVEFTPTVKINNSELPGSISLQVDGENRALPQLPPFTVSINSFFAYSDYAPRNSFDSRYFGDVPMENIIGTIRPLVLFPL